jgi:hypothetical protein
MNKSNLEVVLKDTKMETRGDMNISLILVRIDLIECENDIMKISFYKLNK